MVHIFPVLNQRCWVRNINMSFSYMKHEALRRHATHISVLSAVQRVGVSYVHEHRLEPILWQQGQDCRALGLAYIRAGEGATEMLFAS